MGEQACALKIILDSRRAASAADAIADTTLSMSLEQATKLTDEVAYPIIEQIIKAEHALDKAENLLLDAVGYDGPRPNTPYKHE